MSAVADVLVCIVALEHLWFLVLEMFLWTKPLGIDPGPRLAALIRRALIFRTHIPPSAARCAGARC
jgi:hypothetical protein